ncbi:MAG: hypothetical protein ACK4FB_09025 [Brevundimonas sp.]|uniref:hypothetical protein n=1 Tax=Brevundimonas sp. TaxID=1871086 RepID=UPI00391CE5FD
MKAVQAFQGRQAQSAAAQGGEGGGFNFSGKQLGGMSRGLSVAGSIMEFAGNLQKAGGMRTEARMERMSARQEYIQADEQVNAIDAAYNQLIGDQMAAAGGMGIDVSSGSVVAQRNAARDAADRERRILRNSADANASLRRLRSIQLKDAAKNQVIGASLKLGFDVASSFVGG